MLIRKNTHFQKYQLLEFLNLETGLLKKSSLLSQLPKEVQLFFLRIYPSKHNKQKQQIVL